MKTALLCTLVALLHIESLVAAAGSSCPIIPGLPGRDGMPGPQGPSGTCACYEEPPCPRSLGQFSYNPAKSCREILQCNPSAQSGYYWLKSTTTECREVYCDMDTNYCNITGGWMRLAYFNMAEPGASCPTSLQQISTPARLCGRTGSGCSSVNYPTEGVRYRKVCGQARGYQYDAPDAFGSGSTTSIDSFYVDGISITYGSSPRTHLWTYATGQTDDDTQRDENCPCAEFPGTDPPDFVGEDYYCESGMTGTANNEIALEDPLWDGIGCSPGNNCCNQTGMPWFYRTLAQDVSDDIEVRLCSNRGYREDEETYVELVEIYVQ